MSYDCSLGATWRLATCAVVVLAFAATAAAVADEPTGIWKLREELNALKDKGEFDKALIVAQSIVAHVTAVHGREHLETARSLYDEADLNAHLGKYADALRLYAQALSIRETQLGPVDPSVADVLVSTAVVLRTDLRNDEATPLVKRALAIREKHLGLSHPDTADTLNQLGLCLFTQESYDEAGSFFERCLVIREAVSGPRHPETAQALTNLGIVYRERENYEKAKMLVVRAYAIRREAFGQDHELTVDSVDDLGMIWFLEGNYEGAEKCFGRVLEFRRGHFGDDDPQVPRTANLLIAAYRAQGKEAQAAALEQSFASAEPDSAPTGEDAPKEINGN